MAQTTIAGKFLDPTVISALDAITDGASASDFLLVWDASDSTLKKLLPDNLGLGAATIKTTYASHGLAVGDVVKPSGTDNQYNKALATTAANAEVVGIVTAVSGNAVTITISGEISTGAVSGFDYADATAGTILFLSATAGLLTSTEPTTEGQISKPVAIVTQDDAKIVLIIQRGEVIGTGVQTDAPNDATYVTLSTNSTLTAERTLAAGSGITLTDAGANGAATISIANDAIDSQHYNAGSIDLEHMSSQSVDEDNLHISNAGNDGEFLSKQSGNAGGLTWAAAGGTAPVFGRVKRTSADVTTTSTSLVDFTGASITFTTGAFPIAYGQIATSRNSTAGAMIAYNVMIDSTLELGTIGIATDHPAANYNADYSFTGQSVALSAASHTIKLQWRVSAGTALGNADTGYAHIFWAHEIR